MAGAEEAFRAWAEELDRRGLVLLDPQARVARWNRGAADLTGYAADEAIGRSWTDFAELPDSGVVTRSQLRRKDGASISVDLVSDRLRDACVGIVVSPVDAAFAALQGRYRALVDHAADPLFAFQGGVVIDANVAACESLGYTRDEMIGMRTFDFDPDVTPAMMDSIRERLLAGETVRFESRHRRKDGATFPVEVHVRRYPSDDPPIALSLVRDITARKRSEAESLASQARYEATVAALRESEERFTLALRGANDGIWDWNLLTDDVVFSGRWKSMLGYAESELADHVGTWRLLLHPDDRVSAEERVRQYLAGEIDKYEIEFRMAHKAGGYRTILSRGFLVWDEGGRPVRFVGTHVDITERKDAELALRTSEEMLRRAQAIAHVVNWTFDIRAGEFAMSDAAAKMMGLTPGGGVPDLVGAVHPDDRQRFQAVWRAACHGTPYDLELRLGDDGDPRWVCMRATTDLDDEGRARTMIGVTQDVTERRKLEAQFQQAQKMEAVGQLAGGIAHDFNNLLTVVGCSADILLERLPAGELRDEVVEIRAAGARAADLTQQLLAFSRKQMFQLQVVDLNEVVVRSERLLRRLIDANITIVTELDPALGRIDADPGQIEQVILNLVVNARDAMPTGGTLRITTRNTGAHVELSVSDTGVGVPDHLKAKIFEPFFSTKGVGKGTGLGLSTVYGIVKQSGGDVSIESRVGAGTTLTLLFPASSSAPPTPKPHPEPPSSRHGTETILLVEDEGVLRRIARRTLERHGYTILEAANGEEAIAHARAHDRPIDLLLTDVVMPGMSGRQVADVLRTEHPGLRVLFMSGYTDDAIVRHGVLAATDHFLAKPFAPTALVNKVRSVLDEGQPSGPASA